MKKLSKKEKEKEAWIRNWYEQKQWVNNWLHNKWGLDEDDLLNAGRVSELCESIVYDALKEFASKKEIS